MLFIRKHVCGDSGKPFAFRRGQSRNMGNMGTKSEKKVFSVKIQLSTRASSAIFCLFENIKFVEEK